MFGQFSQIDNLFALPVIISAVFGCIFLSMALLQIYKKKILKCCIQSIFAFIFISISIVFFLLGLNLYTYQRLTKEEEIATIQFWTAGPQQYLAEFSHQKNGLARSFIIYGDEWQVDARILKWKTSAILAGLDSRYRFERLSGRYKNIDQEMTGPRSVFDLSYEPGLTIWPVINKLRCCLDWIDAYYGNSTYLPMADQAVFEIVLTQSGILSRPANIQAKHSVENW